MRLMSAKCYFKNYSHAGFWLSLLLTRLFTLVIFGDQIIFLLAYHRVVATAKRNVNENIMGTAKPLSFVDQSITKTSRAIFNLGVSKRDF